MRVGGVLDIVGKILTRATTFLQTSLQLKVYKKIMGIQNNKNPNLRNFGTPDLRVLGKMTFGLAPMVNQKKYYKGEGGGFPQVRAMMSLVNLCMFMACLCIKSAPVMH
jgi:hypothetical protein